MPEEVIKTAKEEVDEMMAVAGQVHPVERQSVARFVFIDNEIAKLQKNVDFHQGVADKGREEIEMWQAKKTKLEQEG